MINPLTESNLALVNEYKEIHEELEKYKSEFSGYGDWEECVNEHIVRALSIHLSKKYFDIDFTNRRIESVSYTHLDVYKRQIWMLTLKYM